MDRKLQNGSKDQENDKSIFSSQASKQQTKSEYAEEVEKKKMADHERLKGNEFMHSKDYKDAIDCYSKSI